MIPAPYLVSPAEAGIQRLARAAQIFPTFVCRLQPRLPNTMRTTSRHPSRHSSDQKHAPYPDTGLESRRGGERLDHHTMAKPRCIAIFIPLCGLRRAIGDSGPLPRLSEAGIQRGVRAAQIFVLWCAGAIRDERIL